MQELKHERVKAGTTLAHCYWPLGQLENEIKVLKGCLLVVKLGKTYFPKPVPPPRFKFEVKLARLASRSPDTNFPPTVVPPLVLPWAAPPTPPWGCRISPKNEAPTPVASKAVPPS